MTVICNVYKSVNDLLPHFFSHYYSYGVKNFIFGVWNGDKNPVWNQISTLSPYIDIDVKIFKSYDEDIDGTKEGETTNMLRIKSLTDWIIPTDLDEFHFPGDFSSFDKLFQALWRSLKIFF